MSKPLKVVSPRNASLRRYNRRSCGPSLSPLPSAYVFAPACVESSVCLPSSTTSNRLFPASRSVTPTALPAKRTAIADPDHANTGAAGFDSSKRPINRGPRGTPLLFTVAPPAEIFPALLPLTCDAQRTHNSEPTSPSSNTSRRTQQLARPRSAARAPFQLRFF